MSTLATTIFGRAHAEEADPDIGGVTKVTVTLRLVRPGDESPAALEKTFFQRMPTELAALDDRFREMMAACERDGVHAKG